MNHKIITYGNLGYVEFLKNFYVNLDRIGISKYLRIFCLDDESFNLLKDYAINAEVVRWHSNNSTEKILDYGEEGWDIVMEAKLEIIYQSIQDEPFILYSDADIFFTKNPMSYLDNLMMEAYNDVLFMLDWNGDACAGFFYARNSKNCLNLFKPQNAKEFKDFDQTLINERLRTYPIKHENLDAKLFSNGPLWRGGVSKWRPENHYVAHYNATPNSEKINDMKKYGHWLLDRELS
tara:strand:- start:5500 stop:6204 length:705 start_codon:yes stop_codon:yes gene_type:complete